MKYEIVTYFKNMQTTDKKDIDETKFEDEVERVTLKHCGDKTLE